MARPSDPSTFAQDHVRYEVENLAEQFARLPDSDPVLQNALCVSVMIHARVLWDFLQDTEEARAKDYAPGWNPDESNPSWRAQGVNKQVAHLAAKREALVRAPFEVEAAFAEVKTEFLKFAQLVDASQEPWITDAVNMLNSVPTPTLSPTSPQGTQGTGVNVASSTLGAQAMPGVQGV